MEGANFKFPGCRLSHPSPELLACLCIYDFSQVAVAVFCRVCTQRPLPGLPCLLQRNILLTATRRLTCRQQALPGNTQGNITFDKPSVFHTGLSQSGAKLSQVLNANSVTAHKPSLNPRQPSAQQVNPGTIVYARRSKATYPSASPSCASWLLGACEGTRRRAV